MSQQAVMATAQELANDPRHNGFKCFCGDWFPNRELFDEHLKGHPGTFTVCDDCKRTLPKGAWTVDENGNFVSVLTVVKGTRLGETG